MTDFLFRPHPAVRRERDAVHKIDRDAGVPPEEAREILRRLQSDTLTAAELERSPHTRTLAEARAQVQSLFQVDGPASGSTVLDIGADSAWASSLLPASLSLLVRPLLSVLQVSVHLRARKPAA